MYVGLVGLGFRVLEKKVSIHPASRVVTWLGSGSGLGPGLARPVMCIYLEKARMAIHTAMGTGKASRVYSNSLWKMVISGSTR